MSLLSSVFLCILLFVGAINATSDQDTPSSSPKPTSAPTPTPTPSSSSSSSSSSSPPPPPPSISPTTSTTLAPPPSPASDTVATEATKPAAEQVDLPSGPVSAGTEPSAVDDQITTEPPPATESGTQQQGEATSTGQETTIQQSEDESAPPPEEPEQQPEEPGRQQAKELEQESSKQQREQEQPEQKEQPEQLPERQTSHQPNQPKPQQEPEPERKPEQPEEEQQPEQKQISEQQQPQTDEAAANIKPDVASIQEVRQPALINNTISQVETNEIPESRGTLETINGTSIDLMNEDRFNYNLEPSCNLTSVVPSEIIQMAARRILKTTGSKECSAFLDLKLKPMINQRIKGYVMEVSSMPVDLDALTGALSSQISCSNIEDLDQGKKIKFNMIFAQDLGDKRLESKWRSYAEIQHDDISVRLFGTSISRRGLSKTSSKCQKFKLELGDFYLDLLSFKTKLLFEITLVKLDERAWSAKDHIGGGQILLKKIQVDELYLDDRISLNSIGKHKLNIASPTVQILHDQNNHFRRNNWLLDLYGNWLKHEYKRQISKLLDNSTFLDRLNSCFSHL